MKNLLEKPGYLILSLITAAGLVYIAATRLAPGKAGMTEIPDRPNVVLIIIDTLRADKLGGHWDFSPEIDRMAGVRFTNVLAQSSWTRPSHASFLTGLHPRDTGIYNERFDSLNSRFETLAEVLQGAGYTTIGLTANPTINSVFNFDQGFDKYFDSTVVWDFMKDELILKEDAVRFGEENRLAQARDIFDRTLEIAGGIKKGPVFIMINLMDVHESDKSAQDNKTVLPLPEEQTGEGNAAYNAAVKYVSSETGRFVDKLEKLNGWKNTLFVITSDHGQGLDDHGSLPYSEGHGRYLYESQLRVPLVLYNPAGGLPVKKIDETCRLMDMMPTLLDYLKIRIPASVKGVSLYGLINGKFTATLPEYFIAETYFRGADKIAVYSRNWKFFKNMGSSEGLNRLELQAMGKKEEGVLTDMAASHPDVVEKHIAYLETWEKEHRYQEVTPPVRQASDREIEQLKSLGYLQ